MQRLKNIIYLMPLLVFSLGFNTLEEPEYYPDSNGKISNAQRLEGKFTEDEAVDGKGFSLSSGRRPQSVKGDSETMDLDINPEQADKYGVQEFSIIVTDKGFFPNKLVVRRNIPVNLFLTSTNSQSLCFVMKNEEYNFHKGVGAKQIERVSFRPTQVGPYKFHCPINNIEGTLIVRD